MNDNTKPQGIHAAMMLAQEEIANRGIAKMSKANLGGSTVAYRGIEIAMNEMSVVLIHAGITVTPDYSDLTVSERAKAEVGKFTRFCTIKGAFTFAAADGSSVRSVCYGEAMDSGDKAVIKAQSVAFRTALFQTFVIPTMAMDTEVDDGEEPEGETRTREDESPAPPPAQPRGEVGDYSKEQFETNFPTWEKAIKSGSQTAESIIKKVETRGKLNPVQTAKLKAVK